MTTDPHNKGEVTPDGSRVYKHGRRTVPERIVHGDADYVDAVSSHIEKHIGPIEMVWHEIVSDLVHIDVYHVAPTKERAFHTLVTGGMGEAPMSGPQGSLYGELLTVLPSDWRLTKEDFKEEANWWPVRMLKACARMPHEYDTWLGPGHTVPNGDPPEPFAAGTNLCGVMMTMPYSFHPDSSFFEHAGHNVGILQMIPLTLAETEYKLNHGAERLEHEFNALKLRIPDLYRPGRPCAASKRRAWWKLF